MTALSPQQKERQRSARARSSRIRMGMVNYLQTLGDVIAARAENDHLTLGYKSWQEYLDTEYGAERLKLTPELQQKAIVELRLAGASQREIGYTLGLNQSNVSRALTERSGDADASPDEIYDRDGNLVPPAKSAVVEAMTGAIEDAEQRAQDHRETGEADGSAPSAGAGSRVDEPAPTPDHPDAGPGEPVDLQRSAEAAGAVGHPAPAAPDPGVAAPAEEADAPAASSQTSSDPDPATPPVGEGEQGGPATSPAGPPCEKCAGQIGESEARAGYRRCSDCDEEGDHVDDGEGGCRGCTVLAETDPAYAALSVAETEFGLAFECGECDGLVAHLAIGASVPSILAAARQHASNCP